MARKLETPFWIVIPVKAGIQWPRFQERNGRRVPAFAGTTTGVGVYGGFHVINRGPPNQE